MKMVTLERMPHLAGNLFIHHQLANSYESKAKLCLALRRPAGPSPRRPLTNRGPRRQRPFVLFFVGSRRAARIGWLISLRVTSKNLAVCSRQWQP